MTPPTHAADMTPINHRGQDVCASIRKFSSQNSTADSAAKPTAPPITSTGPPRDARSFIRRTTQCHLHALSKFGSFSIAQKTPPHTKPETVPTPPLITAPPARQCCSGQRNPHKWLWSLRQELRQTEPSKRHWIATRTPSSRTLLGRSPSHDQWPPQDHRHERSPRGHEQPKLPHQRRKQQKEPRQPQRTASSFAP